ncbi:hypothetical protein P170DRAFT_240030 [Aspergillus steynii IBT 23096]|uniref:Uncharacterized protein n=1 Tax=Aspergillus steynii IBT 23096 TaxID=1392250 RepID=A0A2I2G3C6_9EURO|nr:uncharacterized protein P170DRAFT_240030 [Aspergillus steynii IBT 23096]PLB47379.1 hypothetical protein P170DRAFT_240030 [Aspergillus steynii IBT 23096]
MSGHPLKKLRELWRPVIERLPSNRSDASYPPQNGPVKEGWRPFALRPLYLTLIAAAMLLMFVTIETLRRYTDQYGGLVLMQATDEVSSVQSFAYNYVPIIVALILVILWSFIDFDVLRLEPYFQLSRPEGAPASVLFINYNFGQTVITPLTSAKRGHWIVLLVSFLSLFIRMILPALQSTLLELREVTVITDQEMKTWPTLVDLDTQGRWISSQEDTGFDTESDFGSDDSSTVRRGRSSHYAVAPVEIPREDRRETTVWTVNQTVYWVQSACHDVFTNDSLTVAINKTDPELPRLEWSVTGVQLEHLDAAPRDCTLDFSYDSIFFPATDFLQVRYWEPVQSNRTLKSEDGRRAFTARGCNPFDLYGVLISVNATEGEADALTQLGPQYTSSATMFACNVDYRRAEAAVSMHANSSITGIQLYNETIRSLNDTEFNLEEFRGLLAHRAPYTSDIVFMQYNRTMGDRTITELPVVSQDMGDIDPVLVLDTSTVMGQDEFQDKVTRGARQTFILTMSRLFNPDVPPTVMPALRLTKQVAIAVVDFAAMGSEVILALGVLMTLTMVYFYRTRDNIMQGDPGSIGAMCSMVTDVLSPTNVLADPASDFHQFSTRQLRMHLRNYRLYWHDGPTGRRVDLVTTDGSPVSFGDQIRTRFDPRPHFLVIPIFIVEFLLLAAIIAVMSLIIASLAHEGSFQHLTQSDSSFFQVVLSFLPSVVASAVGALCNSIHRNISILEPWVHLQRGKAKANSSLSMNYAAQNPWAVLVKTVRDRNLLLGLVSLACAANTILTVVAGGLFEQQLTTSYLPTSNLRTNYSQSVFHQTDFAADFTEYDLIQTSITSGVPMLPWTVANYSFVPLKISNPDSDAMYEARTLGIGAELECRQLSVTHDLVTDPTTGSRAWQYQPFRNASRQCVAGMDPLTRNNKDVALSIHFLSPIPEDDRDQDECQTTTTVIVGRWNYTAHAPPTDSNTIALQCEPRVRMKKFDLTFDQKGQIQDHEPVNDSVITDGSMFDNATVSLGQFNKVFAAIPQSFVGEDPDAHEGFVSSYDWAGFLVARLYKQQESALTPLVAEDLTRMSQTVYQWVYSTYFSLWRRNYLQPLANPPVADNATVIYNTWAMVPSVPSLAIALLIIALDTLVVLVVFGTRRGRFQGPRIPRSIGAVIPWLANSRMRDDLRGTNSWSSQRRREYLNGLDKRYGFRMFLGEDGRWRYAVDEEPSPEKPPAQHEEASDAGKTGPPVELRELDELDETGRRLS